MKNAHLRFGWLTYVKSTEKTTTSIKLRLDRFIGEVLPDPPRHAKAHLISVIGGDTQVAAVSAAVSLGDRFMVEGPGVQPIRVCLERNAQCFKGSIQLAGRKKPLRHLIALSEEFASSNVSTSSGRTLLASSESGFIWASIAHIHGIPGIPDWADWFAGELKTHRAIMPALGIGCDPAIVKGQKEQFLDWLSWGVESGAVKLPAETGTVRWPGLSLEDNLLTGQLGSEVWTLDRNFPTSEWRGLQIPAGHPIRLNAEGYTTMSNGASGRKNVPSLEMDRLATEAMQCWADFQEGLSSDKQKYPVQQFRAFWAVTKRYAELTRSDTLIHRSVAGAVHGLVDFLEAERKRVPGDVLRDAERLECLLFSGYDPHFEGDEPPGL